MVPAVQSNEQAETAVLAVTEDPACVASFTSLSRLELYTVTGQKFVRDRYGGVWH